MNQDRFQTDDQAHGAEDARAASAELTAGEGAVCEGKGPNEKDGRRGTYDKERRAPVATDDGDILATTTT